MKKNLGFYFAEKESLLGSIMIEGYVETMDY